jgi:hypothetical protein
MGNFLSWCLFFLVYLRESEVTSDVDKCVGLRVGHFVGRGTGRGSLEGLQAGK